MAERRNWSEEETILAFYYYCQIPFGKINQHNPEIIRIAKLIGRTPSAVVFKMGNLAHFDPAQKKRNVTGLSNASKLDQRTVARFHSNWEELALLGKQIEVNLKGKPDEELHLISLEEFPEGITKENYVKTRVNQQFFRNAVLSSYQNRCCMTGLAVASLLIASHIKPWSKSDAKTERTNPSNGLCLNALHDKAFDRGLITVTPKYEVRVSTELSGDNEAVQWLRSMNSRTITLPSKFEPEAEFLQYHNDVVFRY